MNWNKLIAKIAKERCSGRKKEKIITFLDKKRWNIMWLH